MTRGRPFLWERSYPAGVRWDAPLPVSTLPALLDRAVSAHGTRTLFDFRDRRISYAEFGALADRAAAALAALGLGRDDAVALYLPNVPWHPIAFFGAARRGIRVVHLSPLDAERELAHKLRDAGARTLVTTSLPLLLPMALKLKAAGLLDHVIVGEDARFGPSPVPTPTVPDEPGVLGFSTLIDAAVLPGRWPDIAPDNIALLQYTGGTTGVPKGAMLTHVNLTAAVAIYNAWTLPQLPPRDAPERVICVLPLFHIYALTTVLLRNIDNGNEILLRARFDVEATLADIEIRKATSFPAVPTMWIAITSHPGIENRDFSSLRFAASGGAALPVEVGQRFERLTGLALRGGWGMTETSPAGTNLPLTGPTKPGSMGLPLPGIEMRIVALDDPTRVLGPGETGEIAIRGPNVTAGYWKRPADTAAAFADGFFLTGDIGHVDDDGYFFLVDRKKDMIISGGFNVYPRVIEEAIYEHPAVEEAIVVGVPDAYRGEAAKAFVKLKAGADAFTLDELRTFLATRVGRHEMPAALEFRDSLPKTVVGKLSKKELVAEERCKAASATPSTTNLTRT